MPEIATYLEKVDSEDKQFIGTVTFKNEELALPDGSKMALGIDDGHWVLIFKKSADSHFKAFKYDQRENKIIVDQKKGGKEDFREFKKHIDYFFRHAKVEDLVTLLPPVI